MLTVILNPLAKEHIKYWQKSDPKKIKKIEALSQSIAITPCDGVGKPERLKNCEIETWSRRIDKEHRLVYEIDGNNITILSARFHYNK